MLSLGGWLSLTGEREARVYVEVWLKFLLGKKVIHENLGRHSNVNINADLSNIIYNAV
jgi:hypothetical protein